MSRVEMEVVASIDHIDYADFWIHEQLERLSMDHIEQFLFACHELVINSVEAIQNKKYKDAKKNKIKIMVEKIHKVVNVSITDWGGGIPEEFLTKNDFEDIEKMHERGRGLLLIQVLVEKLQVTPEDDGSYTYTISTHC